MNSALDFPESFRQTILQTYGPKGQAWLLELPSLLQRYIKIWNLKVDGSFAQLRFNFVMPVVCDDGSKAVFKIGPHTQGRSRETLALQAYGGLGAVQVIKFSVDEGALLVERALPGNELQSCLAAGKFVDHQATEIAAHLILRLLSSVQPSDMRSLMHISVWGLGFEKFLRLNCRGVEFPISKVLRADQLFQDLVKTTTKDVVLHGDLHHANILRASREPWLAIDPKGLRGDPAYEVGALVRNPMPDLIKHEDLEGVLYCRLKTLSEILKLDIKRLWGWSYAQCILAAIWTVEDHSHDWRQWLVVGEALENLEHRL